ncbi:ATP phosphoribosyltransferase regulatory subunit [uncultured Roseburia sp.]|uniref:ATP phosphoribosyltransferase regulatory subunit n=1 Tax=Brotonthovivens ammoniilytica TaxID=2981725 RepID=A0ABT2THU3_9FIRM|nr:ATP phosphoribosyltransferase regulatory subunit [Brotonthovivens ammoniilytica]MCU6761266.1 ATP phosphoribosyltransferase regulatory subunit [Brotonthovivens ammoniilytica]SCI23769.1 ATP phosphoribosyltransferase regulatory subunit [uncultured Roseburia sp.]
MKRELLHTPEGVRDIYSEECERKLALENGIMSVLRTYGYHPIQTPAFEFFDIFGKEIGSTPSKDLYKFFDREGNTLVLRPDITPSIARCASKYFMDEKIPLRFCYTGNTFINNSSYQGRLKECTQSGAELIGDPSVDADAEMISLAVNLLKNAGLTDFQISIGHVDFLEGLLKAAGFDETTEEEIKDFISNKNFYAVEELVKHVSLDPDLIDLFGMLKTFMIQTSHIKEAKEKAKNYEKIYLALERLEQLDEILKLYQVDQYVSYELAMLSGLEYYTGIIFSGYTFGTGEAIVKGGRYDTLLTYFGKNAPATGFVIVVDQLMAALSRQNIEIPLANRNIWIVYNCQNQANAITIAGKLRKSGENVELMKLTKDTSREMFEAYAENFNIKDVIYCL